MQISKDLSAHRRTEQINSNDHLLPDKAREHNIMVHSQESATKEVTSEFHPDMRLVNGLRRAAANLRNGAFYAWGHHGACNCGHLLQVVTQLSKEDIQTYAHTAHGEWTELVEESCNVTGVPLGLLITELRSLGLTNTDIHNLEYLTDRKVLNNLPGGFRWLKRNQREDVIVYFDTFADLLEDRILAEIKIPNFDLASALA